MSSKLIVRLLDLEGDVMKPRTRGSDYPHLLQHAVDTRLEHALDTHTHNKSKLLKMNP